MKRFAAACLLYLMSMAASAHVTGTGLATLQADGKTLQYRLTLTATDIAPDLAQQIMLAADGDRTRAEEVAQWMRDHVRVQTTGGECRPGRVRLQRSAAGDDRLVLELALTCPAAPDTVELTDTLPQVFGEHWNTIVSAVSESGGREERVLSHNTGPVKLHLGGAREVDVPRTLLDFVALGVEHIVTGVDHLLFLLALLLGVSRLLLALAVVSVFTLAHAATFTLATLHLVDMPASFVEPVIALSIAWMAWESTRATPSPLLRYALTFGFGLVHGLGFATALQPLNLTGAPLVRALVGFAIGVEIGQAIFVVVALAALWALARSASVATWRRRAALMLVVVGVGWFAARIAGLGI